MWCGQVVASYVEPLVENHRQLVAHPKYLPHKWAPDPGDSDEAASHTVQVSWAHTHTHTHTRTHASSA